MKNRNLLITTIGRLDSIYTWCHENRNFDIALIYYPEEITEDAERLLNKYADFLFFRTGFKYHTLKNIFNEIPSLLDYDYYWMPDDDVSIKHGSVNELFNIAKKYSIELCQPSTTKKNITWKILIHKKGYILRNTNFVEVMCPLFSKKALLRCLDTFDYSYSGWGLDYMWASIVGDNIAIIDKIIVEHTKEINTKEGLMYKKLLYETGKTPKKELDELLMKYNLKTEKYVIKKIYEKSLLGFIKFAKDKLYRI